jgi:hypothetical protein
MRQGRRKSTNPFDSSSDEDSLSQDVFHDCHEDLGGYYGSERVRTAPLDFHLAASTGQAEGARSFRNDVDGQCWTRTGAF